MDLKWITLQVADMKASREFYRQFLGLEEQKMFSPVPRKTICFLGTENHVQVELICDDSVKESNSPSFSIGFGTKDYEEIYQKSKERGVLLSEPVVMGENMCCFFISDPDGTRLQIIKSEL